MAESSALFATVPHRDYLLFWQAGRFQPQRVARFLDLDKGQLGVMAGVASSSVRFDEKIPQRLREYLSELALTATFVAEFFEGDATKTRLWFRAKNPALGDVSPREMIFAGRHERLHRFVLGARQENAPRSERQEEGAQRGLILEAQRPAMADLCERFAVKRLALFGSAVRADFDSAQSDFDFAVEFASSSAHSLAAQYFDFKIQLEKLLGRSVDLIELTAMPESRLKRSIENQQVILYESGTGEGAAPRPVPD